MAHSTWWPHVEPQLLQSCIIGLMHPVAMTPLLFPVLIPSHAHFCRSGLGAAAGDRELQPAGTPFEQRGLHQQHPARCPEIRPGAQRQAVCWDLGSHCMGLLYLFTSALVCNAIVLAVLMPCLERRQCWTLRQKVQPVKSGLVGWSTVR